MARVRVWSTTRILTGSGTPFIDRFTLIPPADIVPGSTVVRVIAALQLAGVAGGSGAARPMTTSAGIFVGPDPGADPFEPLVIPTIDWLWFGGDTTWPSVVDATAILATHPGSVLNRISTRGPRILAAADNVWMAYRLELTGGIVMNLRQVVARVLYLLPP